MNRFSISQIAQFSGIKPHTIRIWEKRYHALEPNRTEGNTRYYSGSQLRRLLNITALMQHKYKVSDLCSASDEELFTIVKKHNSCKDRNNSYDYFVSQLIAAGINYEEYSFNKLFSHCLLRFGMKETYIKILNPLMIRLGLMWSTDRLPPAQEHFISNLVQAKIQVATDSLPPGNPDSETWILFLPEDEHHEISLLFANWLIRSYGKKTIYLGSGVPLPTLITAVNDTKPNNLLLFFVHYNLPENAQNYLNKLALQFGDKHIYIAGNRKLVNELSFDKNLHLLKTIKELERNL